MLLEVLVLILCAHSALALLSPPDLNVFVDGNSWNTPVTSWTKDPASDTVINWLTQHGGWGMGNTLRIDFSINVLTSDASVPLQKFTPTGDFYSPDCDNSPFPVPVGGALEGESGYQCTQDGDCHLLVVDTSRQTLFEMWRANIVNGVFNGGCAAVWNLTGVYGLSGRGNDCTSADAGGFPITTMLFSADEVAAGAINHAIRFILPNNRIRNKVYAHPGTHSTFATSGDVNSAPPYGVRFRLKSTFDTSKLSKGAQVIAKALQTYGMLLADGGNMALTAANDAFTKAKWSDVGVDSYSLSSIKTTDFEVVGMTGNLVTFQGDCVRNGAPSYAPAKSLSTSKQVGFTTSTPTTKAQAASSSSSSTLPKQSLASSSSRATTGKVSSASSPSKSSSSSTKSSQSSRPAAATITRTYTMPPVTTIRRTITLTKAASTSTRR